jgi:hypothetical protein
MRNERRTEHAALDGCDRETDAVDRNGALEDEVGVQFIGDADAQPPVVIAQRLESQELACAVYVALHDVAIEAAAPTTRAAPG